MQWITQLVSVITYPLDSAIQYLNWGLILYFQCYFCEKVKMHMSERPKRPELIPVSLAWSIYNLGQNCWENCILGQRFSKHRSCSGSSLSPFPWKQCCCVFKRKPDPWAFVGSNIELGQGVFFPQRRRFGNSFVAWESGHDGENFLK